MTYQPTHQHPAPRPQKSLALAYVLLILFSVLGIHQFYLGKVGRGILYLLTFGVLGIGVLVDIFTLPAQVRQVNAQIVAGVR